MKKRKLVKGEPWQGKGRKEDKNKVLVAPCGCKFRCEPWYWGARSKTKEKGELTFKKKEPTGYFWFRIEDCEKLKAFVKKAIEDSR